MTQEVIMKKLAGKSALITGGASGIGRATALLFAQEGAAVALADLNEQGAQDAAAQIESAGGQAIYIRCDVRSASDCQAAVRTVVERLDILFNYPASGGTSGLSGTGCQSEIHISNDARGAAHPGRRVNYQHQL
jgi:NAD(P)-dependent dehydrogenase (short-subunit alcohol dehydrogenase family)